MNVCTIIAKNYLAHARVLARSLADTHPGSRLWTLVIDEFSDYIDPAQEPFATLTPADVGCEEFTHMALSYSVLELSTAVKPWLMRHLLAATGEPVTYLDPDIKIYGSLQQLDELADRHGVVLIPHSSKPIPEDGRKPSQVDVMISGVYNLGYLSLAPRPEVSGLLDWWSDRLRRDCRVDPVWGYFVDQRWFDLAPAFLSDLAIVRDPEYNVAYWNLHERTLGLGDAGYTVEGRPLSFFHFSGFDPTRPLVLSRYQDRIDVAEHVLLERLLADYAGEVMSEGHTVSCGWPYSFTALGDGTRFDGRFSGLFDEFAQEHAGAVRSPFTPEGARDFDTWLRGQAPDAPAGISRAVARVYEERADVREAFPDVAGADRAAFLSWIKEHGSSEEPLLARLSASGDLQAAPPAESSTAEIGRPMPARVPSATLRGAPWGVNVVGDFNRQTELGEVARGIVSALDLDHLRVLPIRSKASTEESESPATADGAADAMHAFATAPAGDAPFSLNLICLDPERLGRFRAEAGPEFFSGRYSVGVCLWTGSQLCDRDREQLGMLEELWAPSAQTAKDLAEFASVPVHLLPIPVSPPAPARSRAELGLACDKFLFHMRCDYAASFERQNPLAVIEAFRSAFAPGEGAGLVLDCLHADEHPQAHELVRGEASAHRDIEVLDSARHLSDAHAVTAACDCYVSLHRDTAFGLAVAQAMWSAHPAIATGYSGNLEFMSADNSHLVNYRLVPVKPGAEATWAQPDVNHAAELMGRVFADREAARALGALGADTIHKAHSPRLAAQFIRRRSESIRATGRAWSAADPMALHPRALARLPIRVRRGPVPLGSGRAQAVRRQLRRLVLRAMRPYTAYQHSINSEIIAALGELSREIIQTRDHTGAERADLLAAVRGAQEIPAQLEAQASGIHEIKSLLTLETDRGVYLALSELHARHGEIGPRAGPPAATASLTGFELRAFSQNGEDGVLAEILRRIGAPTRYFVEFGVESGREGNCIYLADVASWRGLFMEADDQMFQTLQSKYAAEDRIRTIRAQVSPGNVERLFSQAGVPAEFDVLSIDVDGQDYWIWRAIDDYRPRVVVIEYNSSIDPRRRLVQPEEPNYGWDRRDYYGASLGALQQLANDKNYRLVHTDLSGVNAFFVRDDLAGDAFPDPSEIAVRGAPNYYQRGVRHPRAERGGRYLDLDSGRLIRHEEVR